MKLAFRIGSAEGHHVQMADLTVVAAGKLSARMQVSLAVKFAATLQFSREDLESFLAQLQMDLSRGEARFQLEGEDPRIVVVEDNGRLVVTGTLDGPEMNGRLTFMFKVDPPMLAEAIGQLKSCLKASHSTGDPAVRGRRSDMDRHVAMPSPSPSVTTVFEPPRETPVAWEGDLCVIGGSCTGVFAAVRAARLGLSVAVVEQQTIFGGMATAAMVNEWHSTLDARHEKQIIGGLTIELIDRLRARGLVNELPPGGRAQFRFNSAEMAGELDDFVTAHGIRPYLGARCVAALREWPRVTTAIIEDRSGRRALRARVFIDATGDGNLLRAAGFGARKPAELQPVNLQALVQGFGPERYRDAWEKVQAIAPAHRYPLANGRPWFFEYAGAPELRNIFGPRLNHVDASDGDQFTAALIEGRRLHRAFLAMTRTAFPEESRLHPLAVVAWAQTLGVRETWHADCLHRLTGAELLRGERFPDAIAHGTYPIDIHSAAGTLLRYLDGREEFVPPTGPVLWRRWRDEAEPTPACYQVPYRSLIPRESANLLVAGRLLDADRDAYGGVRVMVNMNQTGEAAGVAAWLALQRGATMAEVEPGQLRETLAEGGSIVV